MWGDIIATVGIWKVKSNLKKVINYIDDENKIDSDIFDNLHNELEYITNDDKTEKKLYSTGINCRLDRAYEDMKIIKKHYKKENGILAFHSFQSFKEGEVTPELAHQIGIELANKMWGDRFQVVVSTHLNTKHIHNHFVINSVSFKDGYKYYSNYENTAWLRKTSDELCEEYGLSVLEEKKCKSGINFENFYKKHIQESDYHKEVKEDLDYAIKNSYTTKDFHRILESMGYHYYYRAGKLSIRREPYKRNIRVERAFGEEYSVDNITKRILQNDYVWRPDIVPYRVMKAKFYSSKSSIKKKYKPKGIIALYYYYKFLLGFYKKNNIEYKLTPEMQKAIKKMEFYSEQIRFMCKYKLETTDAVAVSYTHLTLPTKVKV